MMSRRMTTPSPITRTSLATLPVNTALLLCTRTESTAHHPIRVGPEKHVCVKCVMTAAGETLAKGTAYLNEVMDCLSKSDYVQRHCHRIGEGKDDTNGPSCADRITAHHITSQHITYHITSQHIISHHRTPHPTTSHHITEHHTTPHHSKSQHTTAQHSTAHHTTPHHITAHYTSTHQTQVQGCGI